MKPIDETTFGTEGIQKCKHIQRMPREQISVLDDRLMVIAEESVLNQRGQASLSLSRELTDRGRAGMQPMAS